eukprot:11644954-Alexandrium_andersonii.AAC.1
MDCGNHSSAAGLRSRLSCGKRGNGSRATARAAAPTSPQQELRSELRRASAARQQSCSKSCSQRNSWRATATNPQQEL